MDPDLNPDPADPVSVPVRSSPICDPSQQNKALVANEKKSYIPYFKKHFVSWKMIGLMCELDAALQFYGQK